MKIVEHYSHLNGEEYLIVHNRSVHKEIISTISEIDAEKFKTKKSEEKTMKGKMLYNPDALNREFKRIFKMKKWESSRYDYYVTTDSKFMQRLMNISLAEQRKILESEQPKKPIIRSYKQTDFVKQSVAVEVQFGKYAFVAYDLFVKHLLFYSGGIINVGVEILPMKSMQNQMSTGIAYYEGELYNILRHGRNNPPVPLLIMGIAP